ncbi:hypothetical protein C8J56DRAFT_1038734 [Mycena floridula]|nr:hypothetical protein C8J56DRAFT_1038734 [Mycena floridula]
MPTLRVAFDGLAATLYIAAMGWRIFRYRTQMKANFGLSSALTQLAFEGAHDIFLIIFLLILEIWIACSIKANSHARNFVSPFVDSYVMHAIPTRVNLQCYTSFSSILAVRGPLKLSEQLERTTLTIESPFAAIDFQFRSNVTLASQPRPLYSGTFAQSSPAILCRPPSALPDSSITLDAFDHCKGRQRTLSAHAVLLSKEFRTTPPGKTIALNEDDQTGDKALSVHAVEFLVISRSHTQLPRVLRPYYYAPPPRVPHTRSAGFIPPLSIQHLGRLGDQLVNPAIDPEGFEDTFEPPLADLRWRKVTSASMIQLSRPGIVRTDSKSKEVKRRYSIS